MHFNRARDVFQNKGLQMMHAAHEKSFLLADDFARDFQNRRRALMHGFDEPIGLLPMVGNVVFVSFLRGRRLNLGIITFVCQNARQRFGVELDVPAAIRLGTQKNVGDDGRRDVRRKS